jgi:hypothetical protein
MPQSGASIILPIKQITMAKDIKNVLCTYFYDLVTTCSIIMSGINNYIFTKDGRDSQDESCVILTDSKRCHMVDEKWVKVDISTNYDCDVQQGDYNLWGD